MAHVYDQDREPVDGPSRPVHLTVVEARALVTVVREHRKYSATPAALDELDAVLVGRMHRRISVPRWEIDPERTAAEVVRWLAANIANPTERAAAGCQILGKGYQAAVARFGGGS